MTAWGTERRCFVDVDGVVADLHSALARIHGWDLSKWPDGEYTAEDAWGLTTEQLWSPPEIATSEFWANLPLTPWADELMEIVKSRFNRIAFMTQCTGTAGCAAGKWEWMDRRFPSIPRCVVDQKRWLASPGAVLIDDSDGNVQMWQRYGGDAVLFPRVWNRLFEQKNDPLGHVRAQLC